MAASDTLTEYDPELMRRQADHLYAEAGTAVITTMIVGGVLGVLVGAAAFNFLADHSEVLAIVVALALPFGGGILGGTLGESRAVRLRAQAQQLLALIAIELNTRKAISAETHLPRIANSAT